MSDECFKQLSIYFLQRFTALCLSHFLFSFMTLATGGVLEFKPFLLAQHRSSAASGIVKCTNPVWAWGQRCEDVSWLSDPQRNGAVVPLGDDQQEGEEQHLWGCVCTDSWPSWLFTPLTDRNGASHQVTFPGCLSVGIFRALVTLKLHPYPCDAPWGRAGSFFPSLFSLWPSVPQIACTALPGQCSWLQHQGLVLSLELLCGGQYCITASPGLPGRGIPSSCVLSRDFSIFTLNILSPLYFSLGGGRTEMRRI